MLNILRGMVLLCICWLPFGQAADSGWLYDPAHHHADVRLRAGAPGDSTPLLLDIRLESGWKTYWRSPGEGGQPPQIDWSSGHSTSWHWPAPTRFNVSGLLTQGYHNDVSIPLNVTGIAGASLSGTLQLPVCSNVCEFATIPLRLDLTERPDATFEHDYAAAMRKVPTLTSTLRDVHVSYRAGTLSISATRNQSWHKPNLYPDTVSNASFALPELTTKGHQLTAVVPVTDEWGDPAPNLSGQTVSFVIVDDGFSEEVHAKVNAVPVAAQPTSASLWLLLALALAGGLILNVMPCVLPVLGMKLNTLSAAAVWDRRTIRVNFAATVAGIMVSFALLAAFVTLMRLSGWIPAWGIQFQNPWFIGVMVLVTLLFSLSLADTLTIALPSSWNSRLATLGGRGVAGSFCEGAFATLLATPCTAPFLGTAIAYALTAPLLQLWGLFLTMGLGMSLPWLLVMLIPAVTRLLPKPGRWMNRFRLVLSLLMLVSSLWLASLLIGLMGRTVTLILCSAIVLLFIALCARNAAHRPILKTTLALLFAFAAGYLTQPLLNPPVDGAGTLKPIPWQPLSEAGIKEALAANKRVFVDITADWCITCKVNERRVLSHPDIRAALSQPDVVAMRGDWTHPSDVISLFLQQRHSAAIPFNEIYGPSSAQGIVLSPLLDRDDVLSTLNQVKG